MTNVQQISLDKLVNNTGQIAGVPKNPRQIRNEQYDKLLKSLKESDLTDYKPLMVYPLGDKYVCLGGNMRLRALRELKATEVSCIIVPEGTPAEMLRKLVIIDNTEFGEYDWDAIANDWDADALSDWGLETPWSEDPEDTPNVKEPENSELNTDGFQDKIKMTLEFTIEEHAFVQQALASEGQTKEQTLLQVLGYEQ